MGSDVESDLELVKRVQAGDKQAFNSLVTKYQYKLVKLVGRYLRDSHEVLDVVQETFIKAYRALPNFRGDSAFYTWLYRIAVNTAKNHTIAKGRRPPDNDIETSEAEFIDGRPGLKETDSPERQLLGEEIEHKVFEVIDSLPKELRMAIMLRELEGLSYDEIAHVMGCPVGTVRSRIFRAREAVDRAIEPLLHK